MSSQKKDQDCVTQTLRKPASSVDLLEEAQLNLRSGDQTSTLKLVNTRGEDLRSETELLTKAIQENAQATASAGSPESAESTSSKLPSKGTRSFLLELRGKLKNWLPTKRTLWLLSAGTLATICLLVASTYFYASLSTGAKDLVLLVKSCITMLGTVVGFLALVDGLRKSQNRSAAIWLATFSAILVFCAKTMEPFPNISKESYLLLVRGNAEKLGRPIPQEMRDAARAMDLVEKDPLKLAQSRLATDRVDEALQLFDKGLAQQSEMERVVAENHAGRGLALARLNRLPEALAEADQSSAIKPTLTGSLLRCITLRKLGRTDDALAACTDTTSKFSSSARAWGEKGAVLVTMGQREHDLKPNLYEQAIGAFDISITGDPSNPSPWNDKAIALHRLHRDLEALAVVERALALKPDFEDALLNRGTVLKALGRLNEAADVYKELTRINPNDDYAWNNLGDAYEQQGKLNEALSAVEAATQINPRYGDALFNKGEILNRLGRYEEAVEALRQAVGESPKDFEAFSELAIALRGSGHRAAALTAVDKAIKLNPKYPKATALRAELLARH